MSNRSDIQETKTAFGLDLGGYSGGGSSLVRAARRPTGVVEAIVYKEHAFSEKPVKGRPFTPIVEKEVEQLAACLRSAYPLYVDVPIDLQGLPNRGGEIYAWQLTKRPVDLAFNALAPLADRIGAVVARFRNLLSSLPEECADSLGRRLFETYPAGSLWLCELPHESYKEKNSRITFEGGRWTGHGPKGERLACIANKLGMTAAEETELDHDEIDATLCALTGVVDKRCLLNGDELRGAISEKVNDDLVNPAPPKAYVLMRCLPDDLRIVVETRAAPDQV